MPIAVSPRNFNTITNNPIETFSTGSTRYDYKHDKRLGYIDTEYRLAAVAGAFLKMGYVRYKYHRIDGTTVGPYGKYKFSNSLSSDIEYGSKSLAFERAATHFYNNAADSTLWNLSVALAESRKTIGLVASTALRLGSAYRNLRKGRVNDAFQALGVGSNTKVPYHLRGFGTKQVTAREHARALRRRARGSKKLSRFAAESWLEMRYGWTPLLYDVYGAAEAAAYLLGRNPSDVTISGVWVKEGGVKSPSPYWWPAEGTSKIAARYDCEYRVSDINVRNANALGLTNPLLVGWELLPFSFVVDWFLPIGNWLESFSSLSGLTYVQGTKTWYYLAEGTITERASGGYYTETPCSYKLLDVDRSNTAAPSVPLPRFSLYERLNGKRFLDSISLLRVIFGK